ncbi:two component transcriptional regulator, LuxR family [Solimonas aquatica]|uniref:Two component transcriptional regulator, LuxR family n=1 Tax=Solimonas aquatica TaxID=489703 RepID=A0A1H9E1J4_9GAMM|nr:response regulator transcription factor [Solimonas aquatica]SEQ19619.1 two component transcriptional regulator, LuxR family [Solimonas aquatica]
MAGSGAATRVRVMLVDDHSIVRSGFRRLLEQHEIEVVAEAGSGEQGYALFQSERPDVVVLDLSMPGMSGLELLRRILAREALARVLVFSMHEEAALADRAMQLGARAYISKSSAPEVLVRAVLEVAAGRQFLSPDVAQSVALYKLGGEDPFAQLSAREFEVFRLLVQGESAGAIAEILKLSAKTVANYHTLIKQKLRVDSDVELVHLALRHKLV